MSVFTDKIEEMRLEAIRHQIVVAIGYEPITASWTDDKGAHTVVTHMAIQDRDRIVEAILPLFAAGSVDTQASKPWLEFETGLRFTDAEVAAENERGRTWRGLVRNEAAAAAPAHKPKCQICRKPLDNGSMVVPVLTYGSATISSPPQYAHLMCFETTRR